MVTYEFLEEKARKKLEIISKSKTFTEEKKQWYIDTFIMDFIVSLQFENYTIQRSRLLCNSTF